MRLRDTDESGRRSFGKTPFHVACAYSGVDEYRHGAGLEKGKGDCKKLGGGGYEECGSYTSGNAGFLETGGQSAAPEVKLAERQGPSLFGKDDGGVFRMELRHVGQRAGDIYETLRWHPGSILQL